MIELDDVSVSYDDRSDAVTGVSLHVAAASATVLLGPSGCGKTTLLRAIAGLERPRTGVIRIGDRVVSGPSQWIAPERRQVGMVFQDPALFPHLTIAENIAFGLRRVDRTTRRRVVDEMLELVELDGYGDRRPSTLSGGQQQRVALARSLAPRPTVLLLDEPFSALDAALRAQLRADVAAILRRVGVTPVFVTHDQEEAFVLGDEIAVMRGGRIEQVGSPHDIYNRPANRWIASFVGDATMLPAHAVGALASTKIGDVQLIAPVDGRVEVLIRPENVEFADGPPNGTVERVEYYGHDARFDVRLFDDVLVAVRAAGHLRVGVGDTVQIRPSNRPTVAFDARIDGS